MWHNGVAGGVGNGVHEGVRGRQATRLDDVWTQKQKKKKRQRKRPRRHVHGHGRGAGSRRRAGPLPMSDVWGLKCRERAAGPGMEASLYRADSEALLLPASLPMWVGLRGASSTTRRSSGRPLHTRPALPARVAMFPDSAHSLSWPPQVVRYNMEAVVFLSSGWLKTAFVLLALFWCVAPRHATTPWTCSW